MNTPIPTETDPAKGETFEFGDFRLDVAERLLLRGDERVHLSEKSFSTLAYLVQRYGRLVTKNELVEAVWPDSFVEENNLHKCIHAIRRGLGEKADGPVFIETVKKHGFRFIAEVRPGTSESAADNRNAGRSTITDDLGSILRPNGSIEIVAPATKGSDSIGPLTSPLDTFPINDDQRSDLYSGSLPSRPVKRGRRRLAFISVAATLLFGGLALFWLLPHGIPSTDGNNKRSVAVLPSKPVNSSERNDLYELGIAESIIHNLSSSDGVRVRQFAATRKYTDLDQDPVAAGREQNVDFVFASNYQLSNGRIKLTAQLFDVAEGKVVSTYRSEMDASNVFAMQDAMAADIGSKLLDHFTVGGEYRPMLARGTENLESYRLYLHAKKLTDKRSVSDAKRAVEYFEEAIKLDPRFVRAYAGLAGAHLSIGTLQGENYLEHFESARAASAKALELDGNSSEALSVRASIRLRADRNLAGAREDAIRAVELDWNNDHAHSLLAEFLMREGKIDEALARTEIVLAINPASLPHLRDRGRIFYFGRRYPEAIAQLKKVIEIDEQFSTAYGWLWLASLKNGDADEAFKYFLINQERSLPGSSSFYKASFEAGGMHDVLRKQIELQAKEEAAGKGNPFQTARAYAILGENQKAIDHLEKVLGGERSQIVMAPIDPVFDGIRNEQRYAELMKRAGL